MKPKIRFLLLICVLCTVSSVAIGGKEHQMFKHLAQAYSTCNAYYLTLSKAYERKSLEAQAQAYDDKAKQMFSYSLAAVMNYTKEKIRKGGASIIEGQRRSNVGCLAQWRCARI